MSDAPPPVEDRTLNKIAVIWFICVIFCIVFSACLAVFLFKANFLRCTLFAGVIALPQIIFPIRIYLKFTRNKKNEIEMIRIMNENADADPPENEKRSSTLIPEKELVTAHIPEISESEKAITARSLLVKPVIRELCNSISQNLSSTTEPISEELLRIRKTSANFLDGIRTYEDEVRNKTTLSRLANESKEFKDDLASLSENVCDVFSTLDDHISSLKTVSGRIGEIADDISEISEKIRLLSFNASIEAARAGAVGKGFRVIAGEIKKLSADTENRLIEIGATLKEIKTIFGNIGTGLTENRKRMLDLVNKRQEGFSDLATILEEYFKRFEHLYSGVTEVITSLSKSMDTISPVIQLHEITSQEIGNLHMVADDFCVFIEKKTEAEFPAASIFPESAEVQNTVTDIRNRLTTENEINALERGIRETVPDAEVELGINNRSIELF